MIKWIKKKIDDFLWWLDGDMNIWFLVLALIVLAYIVSLIYTVATGGTVKPPKVQPIIYLPR